jgi:hypothetical protein
MASDPAAPRVFLLSPAHCGGKRAELLLSDRARFDLADRLRRGAAVSLGEAFTFLSGLYFSGKLTYALRFSRPWAGSPGVQVITTNRGLIAAESPITLQDLREFGAVDIRSDDRRYRDPVERDAARIAELGAVEIILLGSVATGKYVDVLLEFFGQRLLFPTEFAGRGDMSRGSLLLRAVREGRELDYEPVATAIRSRAVTRNRAGG